MDSITAALTTAAANQLFHIDKTKEKKKKPSHWSRTKAVGVIIATVNPDSDIKRQLSLTSCSITH